VISLNVQNIPFALEKRMPSIYAPSLRIPIRSSTLLDLTTHISIAGKKKQLLTYT
jgi:hypothetical protein